MDITVYGINFRETPVHIRERIALSPTDITPILHSIRKEGIADEALILSTCNRTEFYLCGCDEGDFEYILKNHISRVKNNTALPELSDFYRCKGVNAVEHLFRTASSLDSQTLGETEILGQVKNAYRLSLDAGTSRFLLNRTLHHAFRTAKRVHNETALCRHPASISSAAAETVVRKIKPITDKSVLFIGAGKTIETAMSALVDSGLRVAFCVSRKEESAKKLIEKMFRSMRNDRDSCSEYIKKKKHCRQKCTKINDASSAALPELQAAGLGDISQIIAGVHAVISATSADNFILNRHNISAELSARTSPLYMVDIAVPRDIHPDVSKLPCVDLIAIDDLDNIINESMDKRRAEVPRAEAIVEEEIIKYRHWYDSLQVVPTIRKLKAFFQMQKDGELQRHVKGDMAPEKVKLLEEFSESFTAKILHYPFDYLNRTSAEKCENEIMAALELINTMFGLDDIALNESSDD